MSVYFPPAGVKEDSRFFKIGREDKAVLSETHGYTYSRPRHSRPARRKISTGFTQLNQAQFNAVDAFITAHGRYQQFKYVIPTTGETINARLDTMPEADYAGLGGIHKWDFADIRLIEV